MSRSEKEQMLLRIDAAIRRHERELAETRRGFTWYERVLDNWQSVAMWPGEQLRLWKYRRRLHHMTWDEKKAAIEQALKEE